MVAIALDGNAWELVIPEGMYERLHNHLFPGDGDEHGAVIAAGLARTRNGVLRLLARDLVLAQDGADFVEGRRGYRMFRAEFVRDRVLEYQKDRLVYLNVHNHSGLDRVAFSNDDLRSHERGYPALLDIAGGLPIGALVLAEKAVAGDIWLPGGERRELNRTIVVGRRRQVLTDAPVAHTFESAYRFNRQALLFGAVGQDVLRRTKVAIIGLGGVGSLLVELLARLGVGNFVLIEPERIEPSNLPRIPAATRLDALTWLAEPSRPAWVRRLAGKFSSRKLSVARRMIRRANPEATVECFACDFLDPHAAASVLDCDYQFLAADSMRARLLFNAIVHQYLIPGVQIGSKVSADADSGEITQIHAISRQVTPEFGCLMCNGLINASKLREEGQTASERKAQRYVDDREVAAPSVITLNALGASQAANDFMFYITGLALGHAKMGYQRFMPLTREVFVDQPRRSLDCSECGNGRGSRLARGSIGSRLPTYFK